MLRMEFVSVTYAQHVHMLLVCIEGFNADNSAIPSTGVKCGLLISGDDCCRFLTQTLPSVGQSPAVASRGAQAAVSISTAISV